MPSVDCPFTGCTYNTGENDAAILVELLKIHTLDKHPAPVQNQPPTIGNLQKPPKLARPSIAKGLTEEEWNTVERKWEIFKSSTNIPPTQLSTQLWQCCTEELTSELFRDVPNISSISETDLIASIKQLAVLSVAACVRKTELFSLKQDRGQPIRSFAANVKGKAHTCAFSKECGNAACTQNVDYTDDIVKHVLLAGIADEEIKREVLGLADLDAKSLADTITIIESKEMAARAMSSAMSGSAGNQLAASHNAPPPSRQNDNLRQKLSQKTNCKKCNVSMQKFKQFRTKTGLKLKEFNLCKECWKVENTKKDQDSMTTGALFDQLSGIWLDDDDDDAEEIPTFDIEAVEELIVSTSLVTSECDKLLQESQSMLQKLSDRLAQNSSSTSSSPPMSSPLSASIPSLNNEDEHRPLSVAVLQDIVLDHHIFDGTAGWRRAESRAQPSLQLHVRVDSSDYGHMGVPCPRMKPTSTSVITDTGAQSSLMGYKVFKQCGFRDDALVPVKRRMYAANNEGIRILGAIFLRLAGKDANGRVFETAEMVYVSDSTDYFYLSRHAMEQLKIIGPDFPSVGSAFSQFNAVLPDSPPSSVLSVSSDHVPPFEKASCGCFLRAMPPPRPTDLPFEPVEENIPAMKKWLLNHFAASVFNKCTHQRMPFMDGPPLAVHIDDSADGDNTAFHTPAVTPIHWWNQVEQQLQDYCNLGFIEKVEPNSPSKWCHRGFWTRKADGSPRLVVDLQKLNQHCTRSAHHTVPPFQQARRIPANTYRTVIDAWNGYYSVPLREEDRHLFTFSTEFGLYRFCVAPQGFVGSGDGYTDRYDRIIVETPRKTKCVDDTALWDDMIREHWWRMVDHLELLGRSGVVLNPEKFQFCQREIDFAGFRVTETEVKPLAKYLNAIHEFPRPKNIKDIRAWFGLINQVSHYGRLTEIMAPFKPLLSPKTKFFWSDDLEQAFQSSKVELIDAIKNGVQIFDPTLKTCLTPDWSKKGIGYWLRQKYCNCDSDIPDCCSTGWKITLAGSRFLKDAEQRYAPVEGEALAIAWALHDTKYFTLGCDDLVITTDHRPLTKIFGDKSLDEFTSERLFNLRRRTSMWRFKVKHVPGKSIPASDTASRYPSSENDSTAEDLATDPDLDFLAALRVECDDDGFEDLIVASAKSNLDNVRAVTWERVKNETKADTHMVQLINFVKSGFPQKVADLPLPLQPYWPCKDKLYIVDDVLMYENRVLIPPTLRAEISDSLHSAHQGVTGMGNRARATVFWPGISLAIENTRRNCVPCDRIAPSQSFLPPVPPLIPTMPFEAIAADYFELAGHYYLVTVDRFSNWPEVKQVRKSDDNVGAQGLIKALKTLFAGFGVPSELSSDGGPEFKSHDLDNFLSRWGVAHRQSSAYHPRSNGRAEVAVKAMKRLLQENISANGDINSDRYVQAILQFRNTQDSDSGLSPSEVLFGRPLRDVLPFPPRSQIYDNPTIRPLWKEIWNQREDSLRTRFGKQVDVLSAKTRSLQPLQVGDICRVQNQTGQSPKKWDRTGVVVQVNANDQYLIKMHGSGRVTLRNRKFLRKIHPFNHTPVPTPITPALMSTPNRELSLQPQPSLVDDSGSAPNTVDTSACTPEPIDEPPSPASTPAVPRTSTTADDNDMPPSDPVTTPLEHVTPDGASSTTTRRSRPSRERNAPPWHADYVMSCVDYCVPQNNTTMGDFQLG